MNGDITFGIRLKADGSGLVGAVRVSRRELQKLGKTTASTGKSAGAAAKKR